MHLRKITILIISLFICASVYSQEDKLLADMDKDFKSIQKALVEAFGYFFKVSDIAIAESKLKEGEVLITEKLNHYKNNKSAYGEINDYDYYTDLFEKETSAAIEPYKKSLTLSVEICSNTGTGKTFQNEEEMRLAIGLYYKYEEFSNRHFELRENIDGINELLVNFSTIEATLDCNDIKTYEGFLNNVKELRPQYKEFNIELGSLVNELPEKQRTLHLESINDTLFGSFNTIMNQYDRTGFDSGLDTENTFFFLNSAKQKLNCN
ncbi:hypothetical protein [Urechidicola vernalis]|uniref:Uncharacterized protein n=1 Tax=Urechidicola vernalis TaxID=3075600 RepID=A0ABU2Y1J4_9FLAO|nr:hypothetical protein [Urechidicola sp. P050]MDT0551877.1 hypothetical protein [Urechidicola sp. P050]